MRSVAICGAGCLLLLLSGCFPLKHLEPPGRPIPPAESNHLVKFSGKSLNLGDAQQARVQPEEFLAKVVELLQANRQRSAQIYVERYPDVALTSLRNGMAAGSQAWQFVAHVHDQQCGDTWLAVLQDRAKNPKPYEAYDQLRTDFWKKIQDEHVTEALALRLPERAKFQPMLLIDACHLVGNAFLTINKPAEADAAFAQGLALCGDQHGYAAAHLLLVKSEALRRCGKFEDAIVAWRQAVERGGQLCAGQPLPDPSFWERAGYLRPIQETWPREVAQRLGQLGDATIAATGSPADEALVWCGVGQLRLKRGETQAALVAFKRAESMCLDGTLRAQLQLGQAQTLLQLNQQPSAIGVLAPLTKHADVRISGAALALTGAARYHGGSPTQAVAFLQQALQKGDWPGRADAEADLALAYLTLGRDADGLELLHQAQQRYESTGRFLALRQSLANEIEYFTKKGKQEETERLQRRMEALEGS